MNKPIYFVPVDFSESSYKAVQYAIMLTQFFDGSIYLFHVIDAHEIAESDNPIVVTRSITRLTSEAKKKIDSIYEMIRESGIEVSVETSFGKAVHEIPKHSRLIKADYVVIGKDHLISVFSTYSIKWITQPVFVVPESADTNAPHNVLLATDLKPLKANGIRNFLELINKTCGVFTLLYVTQKSLYNGHEHAILKRAEQLRKIIGIKTDFSLQKHHNITEGILDFSNENQVDLLCTIKRKNNFLSKLFSRSVSTELVNETNLPVLVLNAAK